MENDEGCKISAPYFYTPPSQTVEITETFCAGDRFNFNGRQLTEPGLYRDTLLTRQHCDSIVELKLAVSFDLDTSITTKIFPDESFNIGPYTLNSPGAYTRTLSTTSGCDSIVHVQLAYYGVYIPNAFSPNGDGINDVFFIYGDSDLVEITSLKLVDRWGALVYQGKTLQSGEGWDGTIHGKMAPAGVYTYTAQVLMTDGKKRILYGMLSLVR